MKKSKALKPGDWVGVAAPAGPFEPEAFHRGVETLKSLGLQVFYREDIFSKQNYLAGTDQRRADELTELFLDPKIKAIFFARGGYGTQRILNSLPWEQILPHPKIVVAYSDISSLLLWLLKNEWVVFHGPVVAKGMGESFLERGRESLKRVLFQDEAAASLENLEFSSNLKSQGEVREGLFIGGCLSLLTASLKTPWEFEASGKIVFMEDVNEAPYRIDRMLTQLKIAGKFEGLRGLVCGPFSKDPAQEKACRAVFEEVFQDFEGPLAFNCPSGHLDNMLTLPLGVKVRLDVRNQSLEFLEGGVDARLDK